MDLLVLNVFYLQCTLETELSRDLSKLVLCNKFNKQIGIHL